jgi:hypothetical protein
MVSSDELAALTHEAAKLSGITYVMDVDREEAARMIGA